MYFPLGAKEQSRDVKGVVQENNGQIGRYIYHLYTVALHTNRKRNLSKSLKLYTAEVVVVRGFVWAQWELIHLFINSVSRSIDIYLLK